MRCAGDAGADPREHDHIAGRLERVGAATPLRGHLEPLSAQASERPV